MANPPQAFPEIHLRPLPAPADTERPYDPTRDSPASRSSLPLPSQASPSMQKRRRLSLERSVEEEDNTHPPRKLCVDSRRLPEAHRAPRDEPLVDSWYRSHAPNTPPALPRMSTPPARIEASDAPRSDWRPTLPSLPSLPLAHDPRVRRDGWPVETSEDPRTLAHAPTHRSTSFEPPSLAHPPPPALYPYPHHLAAARPPLGPSGALPHDRPPFVATMHPRYAHPNPYAMDVHGFGMENKQRKRRGNLPKETTDKLRAWFMAHVSHPYPSEEEKQELMAKTGLAMSMSFLSPPLHASLLLVVRVVLTRTDQISNWFINARRRQLPNMINNARAEADRLARLGHAGASTGGSSGGTGTGTGTMSHVSPSAPTKAERRTSPGDDSDFEASPVEEYRRTRAHWRRPSRESI